MRAGADHPFSPNAIGVSREHEIDHQVNHIAWRAVRAGVFIQGFIEFPDQLFEDDAPSLGYRPDPDAGRRS